MARYSTGELAKLCGVSVRTVQFYATKGILHPAELSEGGRRLYSEEDRRQMELICLLKSLGLSLEAIKGVLRSEHPQKVLMLLLDEQERRLAAEIADREGQRETIRLVRACIAGAREIPLDLQSDIERMASGQRKRELRRTHAVMLAGGSACTLAELAALLLGILRDDWRPLAAVIPAVILICVLLTRMYIRNTAYICPECGEMFPAGLRAVLWSRHTPRARRLRCPSCGRTGWCVETGRGRKSPGR